jgi:hypothetical protein
VNTTAFDILTRRAGAVSRRGSLSTLGGAALAGILATPAAVSAGKGGKNGQKRCKRQRGQCLAFVEEFCQPKADPNACETQFSPCCESFAECKAGLGIECLFEALLGEGGG